MTDNIRTLVLSDLHIPYHDPHAVELAVRVVAVFQPNAIIINGDGVDFYDVSAFDKNPDQIRSGGLQNEIAQLGTFLGELNRAKPAACSVTYLPGNHEDRLRRYLWRHSELFGLRVLELPTLLELDRYGVTYAPDEVVLANGGLVVKHGSIVRKAGGMSALAELEAEKYAVSTITGHTHRIGSTMIRTRRGQFRRERGAVFGRGDGAKGDGRGARGEVVGGKRNATITEGVGPEVLPAGVVIL